MVDGWNKEIDIYLLFVSTLICLFDRLTYQ